MEWGPPVLIELVYSNRTERLLMSLVRDLSKRREAGAHPLDPVEIVVPNHNMEAWVTLGLAQASGVAANLSFRRLERFIGDLVEQALPGQFKVADLDTIEAAVLAALHDENVLHLPELQPVLSYLESGTGVVEGSVFDRYLGADSLDLRRIQLAARMAYLFQEYSFSRPEMIAIWREGIDPDGSENRFGRFGLTGMVYVDPALADSSFAPAARWQRALWQAVFGSGGVLGQNRPATGGRWITLDQLALDRSFFKRIAETDLPVVHIFGISYVARIFQLLFARLGEHKQLRIYTLNPCAEFWEDVETDRELFYRLDRERDNRSRRLWVEAGEPDDEDPFGLNLADTPALRHWGKPGREYIRLLGELTECDFDSEFEDPVCNDQPSLLHCLQRDILYREPERVLDPKNLTLYEQDQSIRLIAAPAVRREIEWVADEIWRLLRDDQPQAGKPRLRFNDIAVIVNNAARDLYLPQIESVFSACHNLPGSFSDLSGSAGSRIIEAMGLLLRFPFGRFTRAEMLSLLGHPALAGNLGGLTIDDLAALAEKLGIVYGADRSDYQGTYVDEDVFNWDQGIRRLALGAFMTGEKSGDGRIFTTGEGKWLVEEVAGEAVPAAARFGMLVRSLLADARYAREQQMTLAEWALFYAGQVDRYFHCEESRDENDRHRLLGALSRLEHMDFGSRVSGRTAAGVAEQTLAALPGGRGRYLAEGVVVSSFLPMRAIPFKVVFLLGLGEGLFPASGRRDALDLRAAKRRAGDVDPSERDRYMFFETMLCVREKLYLSYIRRDEQTGDPLQPSAVVQELLHTLKNGYLGDQGLEAIKTEPALRRYDNRLSLPDSFVDEARIESRVQEVAADWQRHTGMPVIEDSATGFNAIRKYATPAAWEKLSTMLSLPGEPPLASRVSVISNLPESGGTKLNEEKATVTVSSLRQFLECPMQGWAASMLGLADPEDDLADREEEDFEIGRLAETNLLRSAFYKSAAGATGPEEFYQRMAERLKLSGHFPVGEPGRAVAERHLNILRGWNTVLSGMVDVSAGWPADQPAGSGMERLRFGLSSAEEMIETVIDPLLLEVNSSDPCGSSVKVPVRISGSSEGLVNGRRVSISLQPSALPEKPGSKTEKAKIYRLLLRGMIDHVVLSAAGVLINEARTVRVIYAGGLGKKGYFGLKLAPLEADRARRWLADLTTDLFSGPHAYLLPCESIFLDFDRYFIAVNKNIETDGVIKAGAEPATTPGYLYRPGGSEIHSVIREMADNEWSSFNCLYGPVPKPRNYLPPKPDEIVTMIGRRFKPLFELILKKENF
jgi:exodeoxyribonuclease V gamma subunit